MHRRTFLAAVAAAVTGCQDSGPRRGRIRGAVRVDGQSLAAGKIRLFGLTGGITLQGDVRDGQYDIPAEQGPTAGTYRVEFVTETKTGRRVPDPDGLPGATKDEMANKIPFRYNRDSRLMIDYEPAADQSFDFDLQSK